MVVKGPRGTIRRNFKHVRMDIRKVGNKVIVEKWFGTRKELAAVRTICTHIKNMMTGVVKVCFSLLS